MTTYTEHEQRALDQEGGRALDRLASAPAILVGSVPLRRPRPDFSTPEHPPQFMGWHAVMESSLRGMDRLRRIWAVEPSAVSRRCWNWLTSP